MAPDSQKKLYAFGLLAGYMVLVLATSLVPADPWDKTDNSVLSGLGPVIQNLLHIPLYGIMAVLAMHALQTIRCAGKRTMVYSLVLATVFGIVNEIVQSFVPGRFGSLSDVVLNTLGILAGIFCYKRFGDICVNTFKGSFKKK